VRDGGWLTAADGKHGGNGTGVEIGGGVGWRDACEVCVVCRELATSPGRGMIGAYLCCRIRDAAGGALVGAVKEAGWYCNHREAALPAPRGSSVSGGAEASWFGRTRGDRFHGGTTAAVQCRRFCREALRGKAIVARVPTGGWRRWRVAKWGGHAWTRALRRQKVALLGEGGLRPGT